MSAEFAPGRVFVADPQPAAHVWIGADGRIASVVLTNAPEDTSLDKDAPWCLLFDSSWEVTVTDLGARP